MPDNQCGHFVQKVFSDSYGQGNAAPAAASDAVVTSDNAVSVIQQKLADDGYDVSVDGVFGSGTERAVRKFQTSHGSQAHTESGKIDRCIKKKSVPTLPGTDFQLIFLIYSFRKIL